MGLKLDIVTPEKRVLSVDVDSVRAPGADGLFGVLPGHTPFLAAMEPGTLTYWQAGKELHVFVGGGFVEVAADKVIVLAESAEAAGEIDLQRAEKAFADAMGKLNELKAEAEAASIERARVKRAAARMALARRR